ncbi:unnamed protein product [Symbiodinium natans]|uniref:Uncharacterized protein n=1 Tax=Symbiodinium natans TaxID=878477 RepID=A0A812QU09_9DINO|nr:unnamed protein product [Symbiodinium natans]
MAFAESAAVFESRAREIGLSDDVFKALKEEGLDSMANFAFGCSHVPGSSNEDNFLSMLKKALKRDPSLAETARLRRLFHESYAVVAADLKASVEQSDESGVRKLAKAQQARLQGICIARV